MANRRVSVDIPEGKLSAGYGGGSGFSMRGRGGGLRGFEPPKSTSGDVAPKMDRLGRTQAPVKPVEKSAPTKPVYEVERPFRKDTDKQRRIFQNGNERSEGLTHEELGRIADHNVSQMREAEALKQEGLAKRMSGEPPPKMRDVSKFSKAVQADAAKWHADRMQRWEEQRKATSDSNQETFKGTLEQGITDMDKRRNKEGVTSFKRGGKIHNSRDYGK